MAYKQPLGVADNKSYKNQYHFTGFKTLTGEDLPSLDVDPPINSTIKENPYRSNVNIEGGEVVMQPDLSALFKAKGKKHKSGGMDVLLKPDAFVFSDDKTLAFTPHEKRLFEFKEGGKYSPEKNTPAEVLKKNVPPKHYNTLINNIKDITKDPLAKKTSALMLEKYVESLGNIAYLQEAKKDFPDGLPDFSMGTAPVFNKDVKDNIMESKQYAKFGGRINPYMALGGIDPIYDKCPCGKDSKGDCIPCTPEQLRAIKSKAAIGTLDQTKGMDKIGTLDNTDYYHSGTDPYGNKIKPGMTDQQWKDYLKNESPERKARRLASYKVPGTDKFLGVTNPWNFDQWKNFRPDVSSVPNEVDNIPHPNEVTPGSQSGVDVKWQFTPWQKLSQAFNWGQYAGARRYMPFRSHYDATYAEPSLMNPEQAVGDLRASANQQTDSLNTLSPILRNAQAQSVYGQLLNQSPQVRSQYDNANAGITNQFRQYNNQVKNNETMTNLGFDQQYYQQAVIARQNFDDLRSHLANNAMNNTLRDVESNQSLAYNLLTINNPAYGFDWKTGNFTRNPVDIRDIYSASGEGALSSIVAQATELKKQGWSPSEISAILRSGALTKLAPYLGEAPTLGDFGHGGKKKGGKIKRNPYRY